MASINAKRQVVKRERILDNNANEEQKWIYSVILRSGMTLAELARRCHISRQAVYNWMTGSSHISFCSVCTICYGTKLDDPEYVWTKIFKK